MDRSEFIAYVESNQKALRRFLTALCCGDSALADDIAQETYMKAYMSADGFRGDARFSSWVYRIAYNTFISYRRSIRPHSDVSEAAAVASDDCADSGFRYQPLYTALDRLNERERTAVLLFYIEGHTIKEISAIVDASEDAVKQHLSRARKHLKTLLS